SLDHRGPQLGGFDDEHLGAEARELVGEDRQIDVVHAQDAGGDLDRAAAVGQAYGGIRSRAHLDVGDPALPHRVELGEGTAHVVAGALGRGLAGRDLADDAAQQEGAGLPRRELLGCEVPAALVLHEGERDDLARAGAILAGLQVVERHELPAVDRLLQRLEGRIAQPQPRRIAEDRFVGGDPERAELHERATRLGAQRALAPRHRGEAEQGELLGVEAHVVGQVVGALRDAVAQVVVVARLAERLDRLERDAQLADVVLVAFELPLEVGVVAAGHIALRVAAHAREDFRLGESRLGRHEREHETEQPILDGNRRGDGTRVRGAPYFAAGGRTPSTSMTYTTASPVSSSGITTSSCEPTGAPTRASTTASGNAWASPRLRVRATGDDDHEE